MPQAKSQSSSKRDPVAERLWVEQIAMLFESQARYPRTSGRIFALMLISDEAWMTQADLAESLSVSQASISPALRFLLDAGFVQRTRVPGDRRDLYGLREQSAETILHTAVLTIDAMVRELERGAALPGPQISPGRTHLASMTNIYRQFRDLMQDAADRAGGRKR